MTGARAMMTDEKSQIVGTADILGWSDLHDRVDDAGIQRIHDRVVLTNAECAASHGNLQVYTGTDNAQHACADRNAYRVRMFPVSDTIVFAASDETGDSYLDVILAMRYFLVSSVYCGLPVRAAISFGPVSVNSAYPTAPRGLGFKRAVKLEQDQNWHGCMIDDHLAARPDLAALNEDLLKHKVLAAYTVPRKSRSPLTRGPPCVSVVAA